MVSLGTRGWPAEFDLPSPSPLGLGDALPLTLPNLISRSPVATAAKIAITSFEAGLRVSNLSPPRTEYPSRRRAPASQPRLRATQLCCVQRRSGLITAMVSPSRANSRSNFHLFAPRQTADLLTELLAAPSGHAPCATRPAFLSARPARAFPIHMAAVCTTVFSNIMCAYRYRKAIFVMGV
jgi:hypothetical protein